MRLGTAVVGFLLFTSPAYAQSAPCVAQASTYDAYRPSHLAIVREYGGVVVAHAPLSTLLRLDPYVPSEAALLRQVGGGIPLWSAYPWYPYAQVSGTADCRPKPEPSAPELPVTLAAPVTRLADILSTLARERTTTATTAAVIRARRGNEAERIRGVSISYDGRTWSSAGPAVPFDDAGFVRVGESDGFSVFRRSATKGDLIYVPTTPGMVAPFRMVS